MMDPKQYKQDPNLGVYVKGGTYGYVQFVWIDAYNRT